MGNTEYTIIQAKHISTLIVLVSKKLDKGWQCQGGVTTNSKGYYQSMIKKYSNDYMKAQYIENQRSQGIA